MDADSICDFIWNMPGEPPPGLGLSTYIQDLVAALKLEPCNWSVVIVDDHEIHKLNHQYRGKDRPTDVLSFPAVEIPHDESEPRHLGDIVISLPQAVQQAASLGQSIETEIRFLILHGLLHLLGYDHETDNGEMDELQTQTKQQLATYF